MQEPADVDRELLRLGPRQQHAVGQRVEEALLAHPALLLDQDAVHHGDLAGRASEAVEGDARPGAERLAEGNAVICRSNAHWRRSPRSGTFRKLAQSARS